MLLVKMNHTVNNLISITTDATDMQLMTEYVEVFRLWLHTCPIEGHWLTDIHSRALAFSACPCCLFCLSGTCAVHTPLLKPSPSSSLLESFYEKETFLLMSHASNLCSTLSVRGEREERIIGRERRIRWPTRKGNKYAHTTCPKTLQALHCCDPKKMLSCVASRVLRNCFKGVV